MRATDSTALATTDPGIRAWLAAWLRKQSDEVPIVTTSVLLEGGSKL